MCLCHLHDYVLYTYLRKLRHFEGLSQLMGVACKRTLAQAADRFRKDVKLLITVVYSRETV